ncbi:MAG: 4Fe-4S dicluster domain-containing protein, partial [Candidatus Methanomethylophilaceae archaeon]|nr:4Fe-4S dicluster domain-containing protein [Candidatus Methanomethylophilaceae archaeon]
MPFSEYNNMLGMYGIKPLPKLPDPETVAHRRLAVRDLPDTEDCKVHIITAGTVTTGKLDGCIDCHKCMKECPEKALTIVTKNGEQWAEVKTDKCGGTACRRCERVCPKTCLNTLKLRPVA